MKFSFESQPNKRKDEDPLEKKSVYPTNIEELEEKIEPETPVFVQGIVKILDKCKDYLKRKSFNLKLGVSILLVMGTIEVAQAKTGDTQISNFCGLLFETFLLK